MFLSSSNITDFVAVIYGALSSQRTMLRSRTFEPFSRKKILIMPGIDPTHTMLRTGRSVHQAHQAIVTVTIDWRVDRPLLSMVYVGSVPSMINFLCENSSKVS